MRRLLTGTALGVATAFALGACAFGAEDESNEPVMGNPVVEVEWAKYRVELCTALQEAEASGAGLGLTHDQIVDMAFGYADVDDPEIKDLIRDLIERDC